MLVMVVGNAACKVTGCRARRWNYNGDLGIRDPPLNNRSLSVFSQIVFAATVLGIAVIIVVRLAGQGAAPVTLLAREGRRTLPVTSVNNQEFVALDDLAAAFQLAVREESGAITVAYRASTIVLTPDQALASVSGRLISLPAPPTRVGGRWLVPLDFIGRALALIYDTRLDFRRPSRLVVIGDLRVPSLAVRYEALTNASRVTIDATPPATSSITQGDGRLTVKFDADALDVVLPAVQPQGLVQAIRSVDAVTLAMDLGPRYGGFRSSSLTTGNTTRLMIDIAAPAIDTAAPPPPPSLPPTDLPLFGQPVSPIRTIAIDPGHGGEDRGTAAAGGLAEKELTLAVARRLKAAIEGRLGVRVLLTRDEDRRVPLDEAHRGRQQQQSGSLLSACMPTPRCAPRPAGASIYVAAFDEAARASARQARPERVTVLAAAFGTSSWSCGIWPRSGTSTSRSEFAHSRAGVHQPRAARPRPLRRAPFRVLNPPTCRGHD
jgi:N-acetylmuramoyl-L-alanine amidase